MKERENIHVNAHANARAAGGGDTRATDGIPYRQARTLNLRGGWALIRKNLFSFTASRGFFWTLAVGWMMAPLLYLLVWLAAAGNEGVKGFSQADFTAYYLMLMVLNQLTYPVSHWTVGDNIFAGTFSQWLLRPLPPVYEALAGDLATKLVCVPFVTVLAVALGIGFGNGFPIVAVRLPVFLLSLVLAQALRFLLGYALALLALFGGRIESVLDVHNTLLFLFAGQIVPTVLLPDGLRAVVDVLPYRYMLGFPLEVLLGKVDDTQVAWGLAAAAAWTVFAWVAHRVVWRLGLRRYEAVGG